MAVRDALDEQANLTVYNDTTAALSVGEWGPETYVFAEGDIVSIEGEFIESGIDVKMEILEVYYNQTDYESSFIRVLFEATEEGGEIVNYIDSYCEIDGRVKPQYDYGSCQNNYECRSNLCSAGECVNINKVLEDSNFFRSFVVSALCRITNLLDGDGYDHCIANYYSYGGGASGGVSSSSGSISGSSGPVEVSP